VSVISIGIQTIMPKTATSQKAAASRGASDGDADDARNFAAQQPPPKPAPPPPGMGKFVDKLV
jgi:hypothetical protein